MFWLILTALLECLHFITRWGSLPLSKTFSGAFEDAQSANFQKVIDAAASVISSVHGHLVNRCGQSMIWSSFPLFSVAFN